MKEGAETNSENGEPSANASVSCLQASISMTLTRILAGPFG